MKCPRCGNEMVNGLCPECGYPVNQKMKTRYVKMFRITLKKSFEKK